MINEVEGLDAPVDADERDNSRLIGEVVAEIVISLGNDQAIMPSNYVTIPAVRSGRDRLPGFPCERGNARGIDGVWLIPRSHDYGSMVSSVDICSSVRPSKIGCRQPVVRMMRIARRRDGALISPRSSREMVDCFTPISAAISAWVAPRSFRSADMSITGTHICAYAWVGK